MREFNWMGLDQVYTYPTNESIIEASKIPSEKFQKQIDDAEKEAKEALRIFLEKRSQYHTLATLQSRIKKTTEIFHGVAIIRDYWCTTEGLERCKILPVSRAYKGSYPEIPRYAKIYRNANRKTWGLVLEHKNVHVGITDYFMGSNFEDMDICVKKALNWVALGIK